MMMLFSGCIIKFMLNILIDRRNWFIGDVDGKNSCLIWMVK